LPPEFGPTDWPLACWAGDRLSDLARIAQSPAIAALSGAGLLGERAMLNGFRVPGQRSAGGGCRLMPARDGWVALSLARDDDRDLLPALFGVDRVEDEAALVSQCEAEPLVARGREMGLAIAAVDEAPPQPPASSVMVRGPRRTDRRKPPLIIDLSALWAGPLAAHLLWLAGAEVVKVESAARPDAMRDGDAALFARLNQGKASVALDLRQDQGREALIRLIEQADIVIEAARPRALRQLGIDASDLVERCPGLVWLTITGHGVTGPAADWVGFGDDCGVAGGLSAALCDATGQVGFVGDAMADPLTGIAAALAGWQAWQAGDAVRIGLAMRGVVAEALAAEKAGDAAAFNRNLAKWATSAGQPFPAVALRPVEAEVRPLGADTARWTGPC
jgi:CoA-transferase family III